jgi:LacI family transcriptional regulator
LPRTDGLIVASAAPAREGKTYFRLRRDGAKIVLVDRLLPGFPCQAVTTDDVKVGLLATEHLIKLGHRRIGHLRGTVASTARLRFEGYQQALARHKLSYDESLVRDSGFTERGGYEAMAAWIKEGDVPPAIFAANDPAAIGAMAAIGAAGLRIPQEVAIVGVGNIHYADMLKVPLTTVSWSTQEMGHAAADLLLEQIDGKRKPKSQQVVIPPELLVRQSCGSR